MLDRVVEVDVDVAVVVAVVVVVVVAVAVVTVVILAAWCAASSEHRMPCLNTLLDAKTVPLTSPSSHANVTTVLWSPHASSDQGLSPSATPSAQLSTLSM